MHRSSRITPDSNWTGPELTSLSGWSDHTSQTNWTLGVKSAQLWTTKCENTRLQGLPTLQNLSWMNHFQILPPTRVPTGGSDSQNLTLFLTHKPDFRSNLSQLVAVALLVVHRNVNDDGQFRSWLKRPKKTPRVWRSLSLVFFSLSTKTI